MDTRKKVFICNLAIMLLCVLSILFYFVMPFWRVKAQYTLSAETLQSVLPTSTSSGSENEDDLPINPDDVLSSIDFTEILGEDGITLQLAISLKTTDILSSLSIEPTVLVENILEDNVHNLVDQMDDVLSSVIKKTVTTVVKTAFTEGIKEELKKSLGEGTTNEQVMEELNSAGLDETYLSAKADQLVDSIYQEGATSESAASATVDIVEESIQKMKDSGNPDYADLELSEETKAELKETLAEQFKAFESEDGTLNPEDFTTDFILGLLKGETSEDEGTETASDIAIPLSVRPVLKAPAETDTEAELRQLLTDKLLEAIGSAATTIAMVIKILSYVILATFAIWLLPILKILLKWKKPNNAIRVGLPIWLGSIPYVVLCLLPTIAVSLLNNPPAALDDMLGEMDILSGLTINFSSCAIVSFISGIALAVLVLFFYGKQRKLLKQGGYTKVAETQIPEISEINTPALTMTEDTEPTVESETANE